MSDFGQDLMEQSLRGDTGYHKQSEPVVLCTDGDPNWKEERRKRVTASDMLCFLGMEPSWWSSSWEEILQGKIMGVDRQMDLEARVNVRHGARTEGLNLELTQELLGFPVSRHNVMYVNPRWSHLGATLDGVLWPLRGLGPNLDLSTQTGLVAETYERLNALGEAGMADIMVESKNARHPDPYGSKRKRGDKVSWYTTYPDYHFPQIQTGMWIADFEYCLLCARLGGRDMAPHLVQRDPDWANKLDEANEKAIKELGRLW
jgi:hypothetical protein